MYENNYPNSYNNSEGEQNNMNNNSYGQSSNTYHYENSGSFSGAGYHDGYGQGSYYNSTQSSNSGKKGKGNKAGTGKKIVIATCCGLCFGIFAGLGFQAVDSATDFLKDKAGLTGNGSAVAGETTEIGSGSTDMTGDSTALLNSGLSEEEMKAIEALINNQTVQTTVTDVTQVVKQVMPSVVSVNNRYIERMSFFGQEYSQEAGGSGSGIIVGKNDTELLLVTNYHVVESAEELTVQFVDGSQSEAQIKGMDADKDLAVIAVQLTDIESDTMNQIAIAKLGSSDDLTVGEPVVAIGNALGYGQSVTTGVISALDRAIQTTSVQSPVQNEDMEINTFIQTDAAINPGNSGGALLNSKGEVIGINSSKIGGSAIEGMGYAIPISDAKPIIEDLMTKQTRLKVPESERGYLGITGVDVNSDSMQLYGLPRGIYVSSVSEGTGAAAAGLVRGDIITAINGEEVSSMAELKEELAYYAAGTTVELTIMQGSPTGYQAKTVQLTLGKSTQ